MPTPSAAVALQAAPPLIGQAVVQAIVSARRQREATTKHPQRRRVLLLHARYEQGAPESFQLGDSTVTVFDTPSVLGALDVVLAHASAAAGGRDWLCVTTPCADEDLGNDVLVRVFGLQKHPVSLWQVVAQRFGVSGFEPKLGKHENDWLAAALLAEPGTDVELWRPLPGMEVTREAALARLTKAVLGVGDGDHAPDAAQLLAWSAEPASARYLDAVPEALRAHLLEYLARTAGAAGAVFERLAERGRAADTLPFALVADLLWGRSTPSDAVLALPGRVEQLGYARGAAESAMLGGKLTAARQPGYADAGRSVVEEWVVRAGSRESTEDPEIGSLLSDVLDRADALVEEVGGTEFAALSDLTAVGLESRLADLGTALVSGFASPCDSSRAEVAEKALAYVDSHLLAKQYRRDRVRSARHAARLLRWLATEPATSDKLSMTVADGVARHLAQYGWVDRATDVLWSGGASEQRAEADAYRRGYEAARSARAAIDAAFAARLAAWTPSGTAAADASPDALLPIEQVLDRVCAPLARKGDGNPDGPGVPLILVLDGMSSAVAVELGEQLRGSGGWTEHTLAALKRPARISALAMVPSVTTVSRATLLTGAPTSGGQSVERQGFEQFWKKRHRNAALFHKADLTGSPGQRLSDEVLAKIAAIGTDAPIVGVVLNTIDDALDDGRESDSPSWRISQVKYLEALLDAARRAGRPVVLVSDHGHVLERSAGEPSGDDASSARWRSATGEPADADEVELAGPRVLAGGGRLIAAVEESKRYTARKAGYHGGAALAEMTVPVLVFAPRGVTLGTAWQELAVEHARPSWWVRPAVSQPSPLPQPSRATAKKAPAKSAMDIPLFETTDLAVTDGSSAARVASLGERLVRSEAYEGQCRLVRQKPEDAKIAALVDALDVAGGKSSAPRLTEVINERPGRMTGWLAMARTLLNIDAYPILSRPDREEIVELDLQLLREQFGLKD